MADKDYVVIGLAGMAKNTGKTTTTQAIIDRANERGLRLGLTSIGYDGEAWDNVTRLPKPRVAVRAGTVIATAASCVAAGSAEISVVMTTASRTPLGPVIVGVTRGDGTVVLAGPHTAHELAATNALLADHGGALILLDGAINRIMPMSCADGIVVATGAARCQDITQVACEAGAIARLFDLPAVTVDADGPETIALFSGGRLRARLDSRSVLTTATARALAERIEPGVDMVVIPGHASIAGLEVLGQRLKGVALVLSDPVKLMLAGEPLATVRALEEIERRGSWVGVQRALPLLAITVNPFYPQWRYERGDYQTAYVDPEKLWAAVREAVNVPVVDVRRHGTEMLLSRIISRLSPRRGEAQEVAR